jgi:hypothetical protein
MSLPWKDAATKYREAFKKSVDIMRELVESENRLIEAIQQFKTAEEKRGNPYVPLVSGTNVNVQKAKENLFNVLKDVE